MTINKIKNIISNFYFLLVFIATPVYSAKYAGEFMEIGVGGRAMAMGGAFCAISDDGSAFYWNPSGCARLYKMQFSGMYAPLYGGFGSSLADYQHLGFSMPFSGATIAINWIRLSVQDIPRFPDYTGWDYETRRNHILDANGEPIGYFSDIEEAIYISFARMNVLKLDLGWQFFVLPVEVPLGINFKLIRQAMSGYSSLGMGADAGAQIRFSLAEIFNIEDLGKISVGVNYRDFTRTGINWGDNGTDVIPADFRWGLAMIQSLPWINGKVNLAYDFSQRWNSNGHFGCEFIFRDALAFRMGYAQHGWTAGIGGRYKRLTIDYAYLNTDLGPVNRVSVSYQLP